MNCQTGIRWALLADSGELAARQRRQLDLHLVHCATCRELADSLAVLRRAAREGLTAPETPSYVRAVILGEARERRAARAEAAAELAAGWAAWIRRPAFAMAAAAVLAFAVGFLAMQLAPRQSPSLAQASETPSSALVAFEDPLDQDVNWLAVQIAETTTDAETDWVANAETGMDVDEMAAELLQLEVQTS